MTRKSVVFAGGGVAGIAWETGMLLGIGDVAGDVLAGILDAETRFIGTSAGAAVAAQVATGVPLEDLYLAQLAEETAELDAVIDIAAFRAMMVSAVAGASSPEEGRQRIGTMARNAETAAPEARRAVIAARLPIQNWPARPLLLTAIDTETGELAVFDSTSGVGLVDAVAASCAVPGIWPTVEINGRRYMDGGVRSTANADLAAGSDRVLVIVPAPEVSPDRDTIPSSQFEA
ncbi:MAG: patatin-like phospholipase family protein, partial [Microbacteriaceae bacterium]|nr:patatin-like phospholipase family protein [Microbacteriaceae bacterium]